MGIATHRIGTVVVLQVPERLDVTSAPELKGALERLFERAGREVLIDLADVTYVSSIGLSTLLRAAHLAEAQGGRVVLSGLGDMVRSVFDLAGLDRVLEAHASREEALASFGLVVPRRASGAVEPRTGLTLAEEVLLLALRDEGGSFVDLPERALDFALAGAVLMELCTRSRIDSDLARVTVVAPEPLGDPILDPALAAIAAAPEEWGAERWTGVLAREGAEIQRLVVERLVERGVLRRKDSLLHWVLGGRRYPVVDDSGQREVKERVLGVLQRGEVPSPRDVAIIALADACAVFDALLDMDLMLALRPRIEEVGRMDLLAQAMTRALRETQARGDRQGGAPLGVYGRAVDAVR